MFTINGSLARESTSNECREHDRHAVDGTNIRMKRTHKIILLIVFTYLGITLGIPGVTLIYVERLTTSREDEVALIFTSRAVGSLAGWLLGLLSLDSDNFEPTSLMSLGTFGLFITYLVLPWAVHLWWVFCGFTFQGALMAVTIQGCLAFVRKSRPKQSSRPSHQLVFACLFGCVICPFIVLPFFSETLHQPHRHRLSSSLLGQVFHSRTNLSAPADENNALLPNEVVRRVRRSALLPTTPSNMSIGSSPAFNVTVSENRSITPPSHSTLNIPETENSSLSPHTKLTIVDNTTTTMIRTNQTLTTIPTSQMTTLTTPAPKKPSVIDAKDLSQDASSADGSNAAAKMKELGEKRRIDTVAGLQGVPLQPEDKSAPSIVIATSTPKTTGLPTPTKATSLYPILTHAPVTSVPHKAAESLEPSLKKLQNLTQTDKTPLHNGPLTNTTSTVHQLNVIPHTTAASVMNLSTPKTSLAMSSSTTVTLLTVNTRTTSVSPPRVTSTYQYHHIVEHSSTSNFAKRFLFTEPLQPIQRVYCFLSALGVFTWLLTLGLTGWCRGLRCVRKHHPIEEQLSMHARTRRGLSHDEDTRPLVLNEDTANNLHDQWLPTSNAVPRTVMESSYTHNSSDEDSLYVSAQEFVPTGESNRRLQLGKFVRQETALCQVERSLVDLPPTPSNQWPIVSWPADAWILLAEFFSTGLETTFSGFVHGFTLHYLLWTPSLGFLANSLFWLGGLVGRLPYLLLLQTNTPERPFRPTTSVPDAIRSRHTSRPTMLQSSLLGKTQLRFTAFRLFGGLVCIVSSVSLARFSLSSEGCVVAAFSSARNASPRYISWLGGSLCLGLGVGIASSTMGTTGEVQLDTRIVHRLQLAGHIGQMLVPATVGYMHHLAVFWGYACVLSTMIFVLSLLTTLALSIDLFWKYFIQPRSRTSFVSSGSSESNGVDELEPDWKIPLSPITLHVVNESRVSQS